MTWWIKMTAPGIPEMSGGIPRAIQHPEKVPVDDNRFLSEVPLREANALGWFMLEVQKPSNEYLHDIGEPAWSAPVAGGVVQTYPASRLRSVAELQAIRKRQLESERKRRSAQYTFLSNQYSTNHHEVSRTALKLAASTIQRQADYPVRRLDGTIERMSHATFQAFGIGMAQYLTGIDDTFKAKIDEVDGLKEAQHLADFNFQTGW